MMREITAGAVLATAMFAAAATSAVAMPLEQDFQKVEGVTDYGVLDIKEVSDDSSQMEVRLSQQIMVLQQQILRLQEEMATLRAQMQR